MKFSVAVVLCGLLAASSGLPRIQKKVHPHKIVGGEPATQGELPYQIQLQLFGGHYCGGSLVEINGTQVIVTAAHCVEYSASSYTVVAGELNLNTDSGAEQSRDVARIVSHEDYNDFEYSNDIAIIIPSSPFDLNDNVSTIALPQQEQQTTGDVLVSGWGNTQGTGDRTILQKVQIPTIPDDVCQEAYAADGETIVDSMLCAGLLGVGGKDSCQGDSGGPLRAINGSYLAGIVSWGYGCAEADYPGVNTEVSYFVDWIEKNL